MNWDFEIHMGTFFAWDCVIFYVTDGDFMHKFIRL